MATTSNWSAWVQASTDLESAGTSTSFWSGWVTATTAGGPDPNLVTEWYVARTSTWVPAVLTVLSAEVVPEPPPPSFDGDYVILDSDYGPDVDDLVAHAFLMNLEQQDECQVLACVACISNNKSPGAFNAVNTWHGRATLPVGGFTGTVSGGVFDGGPLFPNGGAGAESDGDAWAVSIYDADTTYPRNITTTNYPDDVTVYKNALNAAPDGSVKIVTIGMLNSLYELLISTGGADLVAQKVKSVWVMGGSSAHNEFNLRHAPVAASYVAANCPVPIYWSRFQIGATIYTGKWSGTQHAGHIVRFGMEAFNHGSASTGGGRQSWDAMNVLAAVRGADAGFAFQRGTMVVNSSSGSDTWTASSTGPHWLVAKTLSDSAYEAAIEPLVFSDKVT